MTKKYFQLRICRSCDEQRMVDLEGYCARCTNSHPKAPIVALATCDVCHCIIPEGEEHFPHDISCIGLQLSGQAVESCDCDNVTCAACCWEPSCVEANKKDEDEVQTIHNLPIREA